MKLYDAEMVEMVMVASPELFAPIEKVITVYENGEWGQVPHKKTVTGNKAEDILSTASAIEMKYGRTKALDYIKNTLTPPKRSRR